MQDKTIISPNDAIDRLQHLHEFATILNQQNRFDEILRIAAQKIGAFLRAELTVILMVNPQTRQTVETIHKEARRLREPRYRSVQNQVSGWIMAHNDSIISSNLRLDDRFKQVDFGDVSVRSVIGVPLRIEGLIIGSIILLNEARGESFDEADLMFLETLSVIAAPYLRNVQELKHYFESPLPDSAILEITYCSTGVGGKTGCRTSGNSSGIQASGMGTKK